MNAPTGPRALDAALLAIHRQVSVLAAATPSNAAAERTRLVAAFSGGTPTAPAWSYTPRPTARLAGVLREAKGLVSLAPNHLVPLYEDRIDELALDLALMEAVGTPAFAALAERRFPSGGAAGAAAAQLAERLSTMPLHDEGPFVTTDGAEPSSLASRVGAALGALRLPFRVELRAELLPLAATGDGVVLVARGRRLSDEAARRTALHEVEGHALPRARAAKQPCRLFSLGTAGGADEQEGYALLLEERAGFLRGARARELALRHGLVAAMRAGADFVEAVRGLLARGEAPERAVALCERVYRGGDGQSGLGRESVYLASFLRVRDCIAADARAEPVLQSGQVATTALAALAASYMAAARY